VLGRDFLRGFQPHIAKGGEGHVVKLLHGFDVICRHAAGAYESNLKLVCHEFASFKAPRRDARETRLCCLVGTLPRKETVDVSNHLGRLRAIDRVGYVLWNLVVTMSNAPVRRDPPDLRQSGLVSAGFIRNKTVRGRIRNRSNAPAHYIMMYILKGCGNYEDPQNGSRRIEAGDAIITFPEFPHSYYPDPTWDEAYVYFRGGLFTQLEAEGMLRRDRPVISPGLAPAVVSSITSLVDDFLSARRLTASVLTARVHMLLAQLTASDQPQSTPEFLHRACALLEANLEQDIDERLIASRFGFGYERFRKLFAAEAGVSPARYRILRRVDRAKSLLIEGGVPIKTIAEQLGYCDVYFFARQFKQVTGKTPSEFRQF
jgi:AraC-like DNA-binding protein